MFVDVVVVFVDFVVVFVDDVVVAVAVVVTVINFGNMLHLHMLQTLHRTYVS